MKIKFNKSNVLCFLLLVPFIEPLLFKYGAYTTIDKFYTIAKLISFFIILFITIYRKTKINKAVYIICLYEFVLGISTILNNGNIIQYCGPAINVISLTLITNYYFPKIKLDYIKNLCIILLLLVIINTIFMIFVPKGFIAPKYPTDAVVHFLGIENRFVFFMLPLMFYSAIYSIQKYKRFNLLFYFIVFVILFSLTKTWSVGAMLGMILLTFLMIVFSKENKGSVIKNLDFKYYFIIIIILNVSLVFFNVQKLFEPFIVNVLHKDVTLTGRTLIWHNAIEIIKKHFIIGIGSQPVSYFKGLFLANQHPHNLFLSILLVSGIIGFVLYLILFFLIDKSNVKIEKTNIKFIINISLFALLFMSLVDTIDTGLIFTMYMTVILYPEVFDKKE